MKKTLIEKIPLLLPSEISRLTCGAKVYDSSCSSDARVYYIERDGGYYLKVAGAGGLEREAIMTRYFHKKGLSAELMHYSTGENDIMLTRAVTGEDCTAEKYLNEPKRLADLMAEKLRMLHDLDPSDCPVGDRVGEYLARAEINYLSDNYSKEHFPDSFGYASGEEAFSVLMKSGSRLKNQVLIHGDYCLPNIMLNGWDFSGFIDLGGSGIGDRHIDLFWGRWSLDFNLSLYGIADAERYGERFLDAYGRDKIDSATLRTVAAAEVFH